MKYTAYLFWRPVHLQALFNVFPMTTDWGLGWIVATGLDLIMTSWYCFNIVSWIYRSIHLYSTPSPQLPPLLTKHCNTTPGCRGPTALCMRRSLLLVQSWQLEFAMLPSIIYRVNFIFQTLRKLASSVLLAAVPHTGFISWASRSINQH